MKKNKIFDNKISKMIKQKKKRNLHFSHYTIIHLASGF